MRGEGALQRSRKDLAFSPCALALGIKECSAEFVLLASSLADRPRNPRLSHRKERRGLEILTP